MFVEGKPNKAEVCSDPHEDEFMYTFVDDDGVRWWAIQSKLPSAFCSWVREIGH